MKQGWEIKKLGDCFDYIKNGANIKQERGAGGIPITRIETLSGGVFNRDRLGYANIQDINKYESHILESEDLLLSHINSKTYIGRTVVYVKDGDETIIHGMNLLRLRATRSVINPFLFYYYSLSDKFNGQIANRRKDAVNQSSISVGDLKTIVVPVPPLPEQERIVAELDCLSSIIERQKEQLKELDNLAQAIFYDMFGEEVAKAKEWATCTVGDAYKFQYGKGNKIPESKGEYPCYGSNGQVGYHTEYNGEDSPIIGHIGAYAGIVNWARGKHFVTYNGVICNLKNKEFDPIYAFYMLKAQDYMSKARGGAAQPFVSYDMLEEPIIFIPPLSLQQDFASKIEAIEKQKKLIKQSITETETLFNSRMDYYFN